MSDKSKRRKATQHKFPHSDALPISDSLKATGEACESGAGATPDGSNLDTDSMESQLLELREQVQAFKESQSAIAVQTVQLMSERAALRDELEAVVAKAQKVNEETASDDRVARLTEELQAARSAQVVAEHNAQALTNRLARAAEELLELRRKNSQGSEAQVEMLRSLERTVAEKQAIIDKYHKENAEKNKLLDNLSSTVQTLVSNTERLQAELVEERVRADRELEESRLSRRAAADGAQKQIDEIQAELLRERARAEKQAIDLNSMASETGRLRNELETLRSTHAAVANEVSALRAALELKSQALASLEKEREDERQKFQERERIVLAAQASAEAKASAFSKEANETRRRVKQLEEEICSERERSAQLSAQAMELGHENQDLRSRMANAEENRRRLEEERAAHDRQVLEMEQARSAEINELEDRARTLAEELARAQSALGSLEEKLAQREAAFESERGAIHLKASTMELELKRIIEQKSEEVKKQREVIQHAERRVKDKERELEDAREAHSRLSQQLQVLTGDLKQLKLESDETSRVLARQKEEAEFVLTSVKASFTAEMNKANTIHQRMQEALGASEARHAALLQELADARTLARQQEQASEELREQLAKDRNARAALERMLAEAEQRHSAERTNSETELASVRSELGDVRAINEKLASDLREAQGNVERLSATLSKSESALAKENASLIQQVEALKEKLKALSDVWVEKATLAARLAKLTARMSRATGEESEAAHTQQAEASASSFDSPSVSPECVFGDGAAIGIGQSEDGVEESAYIQSRSGKLILTHSALDPRRISVRFDSSQDIEGRSLEFSIDSDDHARALSPSVLKLYRNRAHYFLSRYFSALVDRPERLGDVDDSFMRTLVRLLNQDNVSVRVLNNMELEYSPARVPLALRKFFERTAKEAGESLSGVIELGEAQAQDPLATAVEKLTREIEVPERNGEGQSQASSRSIPALAPRLRDSVWRFLRNPRVH